MEEFWGRAGLLGRFEQEIAEVARSGRGRMLAVRGRRQVGKSRLLTHLLESGGRPHLYSTAVKNAPPALQLAQVAADLARSRTPLPRADDAFAAPPVSWVDLFARLALAVGDGPAVVVLDEFPWAVETDPTLEGILQNAWDRSLERLPVLLVLVGSDLAMMERLTAHDRPLFGRAGEVVVEPFQPGEVAQALGPGRPALDVIDAYLVTGGYPRLVDRARRHRSTAAFVADQLSDENSDLAVMAQRTLAAEFPAELNARRVLEAIGGHEVGHATFSDAAARLGAGVAAQTAVSRALGHLTDVKRVVAVETPVGARASTKLRRYRIADPYLRFWFRFVAPRLADIARGRADVATTLFTRDWPTWRGRAVEPVVHGAVTRLALAEPVLAGAVQVGGWWDGTGRREFDLVAADGSGRVVAVGTVKWRPRQPVTADELAQLTAARAAVPHAAGARLVAVCPAGSHRDAVADLTIDAEGIVAAYRGDHPGR